MAPSQAAEASKLRALLNQVSVRHENPITHSLVPFLCLTISHNSRRCLRVDWTSSAQWLLLCTAGTGEESVVLYYLPVSLAACILLPGLACQ